MECRRSGKCPKATRRSKRDKQMLRGRIKPGLTKSDNTSQKGANLSWSWGGIDLKKKGGVLELFEKGKKNKRPVRQGRRPKLIFPECGHRSKRGGK